jgi:ParB-like chromosome segregation protein Spo0J
MRSRLRKQKSPNSRSVRGLMDRVVWRSLSELKEFPGNPRRHPEAQIAGLMKSIQRFWTNPILVDETGTILAGHARADAARRLGMTEVPTVLVSGLSDSEKRAVVIADNRLPEQAVWDFDLLRGHFRDLIKIDFDVELTGFSTGEIDLLIDSGQQSAADDPADDLASLAFKGQAISQYGDVWELGRHRLTCGDAQRSEAYEQLLVPGITIG